MADHFTILSGVGSLMGGAAGLLGLGRRKNPSPRDNMMSQAQGARDAAAAYGFNPLTMLQYGQPGGTGLAADGPPLASFDMLASGFKEIGDVVSGDAERRRQLEDVKLDLANLEIERLRAGNVADAIGGVSPLGNRPVPVYTSHGGAREARFVSDDRLRDPVVLPGGGAGGVGVPDPRLDRGSGYYVNGAYVESAPGWSPASVIEDEYGDVGSSLYGFIKMGADGIQNLPRFSSWVYDKYQDHVGKPFVNALGGPDAVNGYFSRQQDALSKAYENEQERKKRSAERMKQKGLF